MSVEQTDEEWAASHNVLPQSTSTEVDELARASSAVMKSMIPEEDRAAFMLGWMARAAK